MKIKKEVLKKIIRSNNMVPAEKLKEIEELAKSTKQSLDSLLIERKLIREEDLIKAYGKHIKVPFIDLSGKQVSKGLLAILPERIARKYQAVVFGEEEEQDKILLAMADPEDFQAAEFIEKQTGYRTKIYIATSSNIENILEQYKEGGLSSEISKAIKASEEITGEEEEIKEDTTSKEIEEIVQEAPIAKAVTVILEYATKSRASDIHIEPRETFVQVRFRIDGVLKDAMTLPRSILSAIISRVKILAKLKIDEHRIPQDGRFKMNIGNRKISARVSTLPVMDGEKVVMRLLDETTKPLTLEELGLRGKGLEIINKNMKKSHGMILVTGPTGSGKSTTLYSILNILNSVKVNISTVEDPVEYRVQGVNQTQVKPKIGMTFASGLRALLRQDPDIIMVGEIRDGETAEMAIHSALTGHIVLSTLHTNDAPTALPRLLDMNIEAFLIASTVNAVIAQRLVRKTCSFCKESYSPDKATLEMIQNEFCVSSKFCKLLGIQEDHNQKKEKEEKTKKISGKKLSERKLARPLKTDLKTKSILEKIAEDPSIINRGVKDVEEKKKQVKIKETLSEIKQGIKDKPQKTFTLFRGKGCGKCGNTGFLGRIGIFEAIEMDDDFGNMIIEHASTENIRNEAIKKGMLTMHQDGFLKVLEGVTTIEEIVRVTKQ